MAEWLKAAVLKTVKGESSSRVRIPLPPLVENTTFLVVIFLGGGKQANCFACGRDEKDGNMSHGA